jgi:peroxiredoxin
VALIYVYVTADNGADNATIVSAGEKGITGSEDAVALLLREDSFPIVSARDVDNSGARPTVGHPAPNFVMELEDGSTAYLRDLAGRPILINFWATWCPPCRQEMPDLVEAYETHKDEGLIVLEVNSAETEAQVADFVEQFGVTAPVVLDTRNEVMSAYRSNGLPATFFIDREGVIQAHWPGFLDEATLEELLGKIL